jgi:hypothetical protein
MLTAAELSPAAADLHAILAIVVRRRVIERKAPRAA